MIEPVRIDDTLTIPASELRFTASRAGGPGGQHVNKVATRLTLHFDLLGANSLPEEIKQKLATRLAARLNQEGVLKLHCGLHRSQRANRDELVERFVALVRGALVERKRRRKTRPTRASRERRLVEKKHLAGVKRARTRRTDDD